MYGLQLISEPVEEPVTVAEARDHCRLSTTTDDAQIAFLLVVARRLVEQSIGRQLITAQWRLTLDSFPPLGGGKIFAAPSVFPDPYTILIPKAPLQSVQSVQYYDVADTLQTLSASTYVVDTSRDPGRITLAMNRAWPITCLRPGSVMVNFTAGFGTSGTAIPAELRQAILMCVAFWYEQRGDGNDTRELPPAVSRLLSLNWSGCLEYGL